MPSDLFGHVDPEDLRAQADHERKAAKEQRGPTLIAVNGGTRFRRPCSACGQMLTFYTTVGRDKWLPFNDDPVVLRTSTGPRGVIYELDAADTHFSSCPNASTFRRSR